MVPSIHKHIHIHIFIGCQAPYSRECKSRVPTTLRVGNEICVRRTPHAVMVVFSEYRRTSLQSRLSFIVFIIGWGIHLRYVCACQTTVQIGHVLNTLKIAGFVSKFSVLNHKRATRDPLPTS